MENVIAILGVLLFWASLVWLPLNIARALKTEGPTRVWLLSAIFAFGAALFGYTYAIDSGSMQDAFAWSMSWLTPLGLSLYARTNTDVPWRGWDKYMGAVALASFVVVLPFLPRALQAVAAVLWPG